jgi:hypothetical protein
VRPNKLMRSAMDPPDGSTIDGLGNRKAELLA